MLKKPVGSLLCHGIGNAGRKHVSHVLPEQYHGKRWPAGDTSFSLHPCTSKP